MASPVFTSGTVRVMRDSVLTRPSAIARIAVGHTMGASQEKRNEEGEQLKGLLPGPQRDGAMTFRFQAMNS